MRKTIAVVNVLIIIFTAPSKDPLIINAKQCCNRFFLYRSVPASDHARALAAQPPKNWGWAVNRRRCQLSLCKRPPRIRSKLTGATELTCIVASPTLRFSAKRGQHGSRAKLYPRNGLTRSLVARAPQRLSLTIREFHTNPEFIFITFIDL